MALIAALFNGWVEERASASIWKLYPLSGILALVCGAVTVLAMLPIVFTAPIFVVFLVLLLRDLGGLANVSAMELARTHRAFGLAYGRCPVCSYRIADLSADERGLVTCPECAAAWRVPQERFVPSEHVRRAFAEEREREVGRWLRGPMPVLRDEEGKLHLASDPRLPGAEAWLGDAAGEIRRVVRWQSLRWRGVVILSVAGFLVLFVLAGFYGALNGGPLTFVQRLTSGGFFAAGSMIFAAACAVTMFVISLRRIAAVWSYRAPWTSRLAAQCLLDEGICPGCARRLEPTPGSTNDPVRCGHCEGLWRAKLPDQSVMPMGIRGFEDTASA
jgi:hypothetical protein